MFRWRGQRHAWVGLLGSLMISLFPAAATAFGEFSYSQNDVISMAQRSQHKGWDDEVSCYGILLVRKIAAIAQLVVDLFLRIVMRICKGAETFLRR